MREGLALCDICYDNCEEGEQKKPSNEHEHQFMRAGPDVCDEALEEFADGKFEHP